MPNFLKSTAYRPFFCYFFISVISKFFRLWSAVVSVMSFCVSNAYITLLTVTLFDRQFIINADVIKYGS